MVLLLDLFVAPKHLWFVTPRRDAESALWSIPFSTHWRK
jgi:hypothetical protein